MITPTCQVCGTTLKLEDGASIETVIRRGAQDPDPEVPNEYWDWNQELSFRFCGDEHLRSWMSTFSLPAYEPPVKEDKGVLETLGDGLGLGVGLVLVLAVLTGAVYGFLLLLARVF